MKLQQSCYKQMKANDYIYKCNTGAHIIHNDETCWFER